MLAINTDLAVRAVADTDPTFDLTPPALFLQNVHFDVCPFGPSLLALARLSVQQALCHLYPLVKIPRLLLALAQHESDELALIGIWRRMLHI